MTDIVERLRNSAESIEYVGQTLAPLVIEAADEIERLRAALERTAVALDRLAAVRDDRPVIDYANARVPR